MISAIQGTPLWVFPLFGYLHGAHPEMANTPPFTVLEISSSGMILGLFFGRLLSYWQKTRLPAA